MTARRSAIATVAAGLVLLITGCVDSATPSASATLSEPAATSPPASTPAAGPPDRPAATASPEPSPTAPVPDADPRTDSATLGIPDIGLDALEIVPYEGTTDDRPGTDIQNEGLGASPYGDGGGAGPGEIGNYLVTAHRLSAGGPLRDLPSLAVGDTLTVDFGGVRYTYRITETRETSFRTPSSLAEQRAAVPGSPGETPTEAMITVSTCATPEDNAEGNFWRDAMGNPEHRIDKIGVLVETTAIPGAE
ncbi:sortase [Streptomyces sp. NPDC093252]|uniref:sortase domain-containing protein n=1 Tax=Streptomyces sp. NPDC093252 TaxID=3154980 RepID=UPI00344A7A86